MTKCRELVLIGGGHTHALVLHELAKRPLHHTHITLISDVEYAPYSGMLPGHVAGFYTHDEMHIDLQRLCKKAGADFLHASVNSIDLDARCPLVNGQKLGPQADIISINVGSTPDSHGVPGVAEWAIPSKPVPQLLVGWERLKTAAKSAAQPLHAVVVGGGAGGVELTLAMQSQTCGKAVYTLVNNGPQIMSGHNKGARERLSAVLMQRGVTVMLEHHVTEVKADGVHLQNGRWLPADCVVWVTSPAPPAWLRESGLALTDGGFIRVKPTLQSLHHPWVFAAGDVASIENQRTPKSGVFAVRMAKPLTANLRAFLENTSLTPFKPQKNFLSLIGTADGKAVASHRWLAMHSRLMWAWKDWIDRRFMRQFG